MSVEGVIHKFGGSSLATACQFTQLDQLLQQHDRYVVVSATYGTTQLLQQLLDHAKQGLPYEELLVRLQGRHRDLVSEILSSSLAGDILIRIDQDIEVIADILRATALVSSYSCDIQDRVLSVGELWSAQILASYMSQHSEALFLDARKVLFIRKVDGITHVDWEKSAKALAEFEAEKTFDRLVITGFIASDEMGRPTTLGRNGSDFTASIFAKLLGVKHLSIWTDVDGIYSADPRRVKTARVLDELSYAEALEMAYFGASVVHPNTISPAMDEQINIHIRNSFNPEAMGTRIVANRQDSCGVVQGLTSIDAVAMVSVEGTGMMGVSGVAARTFNVLHQAGISVILISQASSEYSICFAVDKAQGAAAVQVLEAHFKAELNNGWIDRITANTHCAILAVVGDGMVGRPGIAGKICQTLAQANINILAISQGSSERNVSLVVQDKSITRALRAVHAGFYLASKTLSIGLVGPGLIGRQLLAQLAAAQSRTRQDHAVNLCVRGIMNSSHMLINEDGVDLSSWEESLAQQVCDASLDDLVTHLLSDHVPHAVIIDCTASQAIASQYLSLLQRGVHVITPNKKANSGDYDYYQHLQAAAEKYHRYYFYGTTVCAGLPVLETLQDLIKTGDEIQEITGVVSGTLAYIFNEVNRGVAFSKVINDAKDAGFTEPDPRDDLSGMDVARKFVCLAREMGHKITLDDVQVHNLVPEPLREVSVEVFLEQLPEYDQWFADELAQHVQPQQKACYVGHIDSVGRVTVRIQGCDDSHPLSRLEGADNMLIFKTARYAQQPLIIQGPGAGAEVTAAGVFADIFHLLTCLE